MTTYIQVLAQDCQYHAACISVGTENHRYLIEAGEGAQRLAVEHKVRIGKVGGVFLTSYRPCSVGGLPGMLLTLDDAGINTVNIYGPAKAQQYLQATKYFMRSLGQYQSIPYSSTQQPPNVIRKADLSFFPIPIRSAHSVAEDDCETVSYLMETPKIPGKFFVDKAAELGIPKGPLFGKLKSGHSITLPNGNVVHPDQVLGEPTLPKYFAVISRIDSSDEISMKCLNESMILQR